MKFTNLGQSDLKVSRICLGTMTWGTHNSEADGHAQMDHALAKGVNFWDTAEIYSIPPTAESYGKTETIIGNWFAKNGHRHDIILASKIAPEMPYIRGGTPPIDRANLLKAVEDSLKRLQTDYLDLYQLHWPSNRNTYHFNNGWGYTPRVTDKTQILANQLEILETLDDLIKAGKIRHYGLSNDTAWGITRYCALAEQHGLPKPVSLQNEYNLLRRRDDKDIAETCLIEGLGYLPWSPLAMGYLSGKYLNQEPSNSRLTFDERSKERYAYRITENVIEATKRYVAMAEKKHIDPSQMALAFCLQQPFITSPIIGATTIEQLTNNIDAVNLELDEETVSEINLINKKYPVPF